jgi:nucleoside-diphosphate-sugar epimerase
LARSTAHVADVARASEFTDEEPTGVYNVGTEEVTSVNEILR